MRVGIISDLHIEFMRDVDTIVPLLPKCDLTLVAGDFCASVDITKYEDALRVLGRNCNQALLVWGNHDYYGKDLLKDKPKKCSRSLCPSNVEILDGDWVEFQGKTFFGATLWFPDNPMIPMLKDQLTDFRKIRSYYPHVCTINTVHQSMIKAKKFDVVVTHHMPWNPTPSHRPNNIDMFYYTNMGEILSGDKAPQVWVHGHTHTSLDYQMFNTRIVCNPYGYHEYSTNKDFEEKVIEL